MEDSPRGAYVLYEDYKKLKKEAEHLYTLLRCAHSSYTDKGFKKYVLSGTDPDDESWYM